MQNYTLKCSARENMLKINERNRFSSLPVPPSQNPIMSHVYGFYVSADKVFFQLGMYKLLFPYAAAYDKYIDYY